MRIMRVTPAIIIAAALVTCAGSAHACDSKYPCPSGGSSQFTTQLNANGDSYTSGTDSSGRQTSSTTIQTGGGNSVEFGTDGNGQRYQQNSINTGGGTYTTCTNNECK